MRIAIVHRDLHAVTRGGICTVYRQLADRLADAGHHLTLITQETPHPLPSRPGVDLVTLPRTEDLEAHRAAVAAALDHLTVDIAECSTWEAELLHYASRPAGDRVPVLVRADLSAATMAAPEAFAAAEQALLDVADAGVAVSQWAARDIVAAYAHQLPVLANGVDRLRFRPGPRTSPISSGRRLRLDQDGSTLGGSPLADDCPDTDALWQRVTGPRWETPRLLWVGKLTTMKGADRLQQLLPALAGKAAVTVVLGHGWVEYPLTLAGHPHVQVVQDVDDDDLPAVYRSSDYLLSTSRWEGFGLAIAEALACGVPALLPAELGTAAELIVDGITGATWRDPADLAALLERRPPLHGALPDGYDWDRNAADTLAMYEQLLAARLSAGR
ncbi:glycosyltransferase family 4 protein [Nonomuraea sp. NPDC050536]|uniref:glycosyltransferase family 4 protein n=1 Tax=Nonomuraea sp. NPDC050536 TaxID=3364366 RepID=UPI0037CBD110